MHGPVWNQNEEYERRKNDDPLRLYKTPRLFLKAKRLTWASHV